MSPRLDLSALEQVASGIDHAEGICMAPDGTVYLSGEKGQIYRLEPDDSAVEVATTGGWTLGLAADGLGRIYACDAVRHAVIRWTPGSADPVVWSEGAVEAPFRSPNWGAFAPDGSFYVTDSGAWKARDGNIQVVRGGRTTVWTTESVDFPNGLAVTPDGREVWVLESTPGRLVAFDIRPDGSAGPRKVLAELPGTVPDGIAFATDGSIVIACYRPDVVYRWRADLDLETLAEDPEGTVIAAPTNCAFVGPDLATIIVPNIGRWHATRFRVPGLVGVPLFYPTADQLDRDGGAGERRSAVSGTVIAGVEVMTIQAQLPAPVIFGDWVMTSREFALVRVRPERGPAGHAYTLTRDGAVAEQIRKTIAAIYVGTDVEERERTFTLAWRRSLASHAAGIGLRALSIVDLACWDLAARLAERSIADLLGGRNRPMPATAIIGYPPGTMGPAETGAQTAELYAEGWRRFKAPTGGSAERSAARLRAAREAAPDAWLGMDAAWVYDDVDAAADFVNSIPDVGLGWFEDVFPPGDAGKLRALRERTAVPIAQGDEQGGIYYPEALILAKAVDVVRVDLTCMGGITAGRRVIDEVLDAGLAFAPHMFPHVHSQVMAAWGFDDVPIEWGIPFTGVHPMDDPLPQPELTSGGRMLPLPEEPGFGHLVDPDWARSQPHDDPDGILAGL